MHGQDAQPFDQLDEDYLDIYRDLSDLSTESLDRIYTVSTFTDNLARLFPRDNRLVIRGYKHNGRQEIMRDI
ncbi:hypothetical protein DL93DRAFT_2091182 [Clavulina sp. PMI_390]|nr:hypothetical protein DL93DRAFT_2091182 [Clavulina sp. PMI_390]